jgi:hypothetical protein
MEYQLETQEVLELKKQLIALSHHAMTLAENLTRAVKHLPEPKMTDSNTWWCGKNRIKDFVCWSDAHQYWQGINKQN